MNEDPKVKEISFKTPMGTLAAKGIRVSDVLSLCIAATLALLLWILIEHNRTSQEASVETTKAIREQTKAQVDQIRAQSLTSCILSLKEEDRETQFTNANSFCRRIVGVEGK